MDNTLIPFEDQYTVFYEGVMEGHLAGVLVPSMLGWVDKARATEFFEYVTERDRNRAAEGDPSPGTALLIHRTGQQSWERVEQ